MINENILMANKLKLKINTANFADFVDKLNIVASIDDTVKIKITKKNILMYSMLGGGNAILAFKNFILDTSDYFDISDLDNDIDMIIPFAKRFVKNIAFIKDMEKSTFEIVYKEVDDIFNVRGIQIVSGKFKVTWMGGESNIIRDITQPQLAQLLDMRNKKWSFSISSSDFIDVKKLSSINGQKIIDMVVDSGVTTWSQTGSWELEVDRIDEAMNSTLILNTRFLGCINEKMENIEFSIFDNFMLIRDDNSDLMLSFEQTFHED